MLELTQWKDSDELEQALRTGLLKPKLSDEIADVLIYLLLICEKAGIDPVEAAYKKLALNDERYPSNEFRGSSKKRSR